MGKRSRDKGKRGEREACDLLRPLFPDVRRKAMQSRGGSEGADLENTPGWHVEVGVGRVNPREKYEQAVNDLSAEVVRANGRGDHKRPVALTRKDRGEWLVTMSAARWMDLVRKARAWEEVKWVETKPGTWHRYGNADTRALAAPPSQPAERVEARGEGESAHATEAARPRGTLVDVPRDKEA